MHSFLASDWPFVVCSSINDGSIGLLLHSSISKEPGRKTSKRSNQIVDRLVKSRSSNIKLSGSWKPVSIINNVYFLCFLFL